MASRASPNSFAGRAPGLVNMQPTPYKNAAAAAAIRASYAAILQRQMKKPVKFDKGKAEDDAKPHSRHAAVNPVWDKTQLTKRQPIAIDSLVLRHLSNIREMPMSKFSSAAPEVANVTRFSADDPICLKLAKLMRDQQTLKAYMEIKELVISGHAPHLPARLVSNLITLIAHDESFSSKAAYVACEELRTVTRFRYPTMHCLIEAMVDMYAVRGFWKDACDEYNAALKRGIPRNGFVLAALLRGCPNAEASMGIRYYHEHMKAVLHTLGGNAEAYYKDAGARLAPRSPTAAHHRAPRHQRRHSQIPQPHFAQHYPTASADVALIKYM